MAETLIFDLETPLSEAHEKLLINFGVTKIDHQTICMVLGENETQNEAILALNRLGIYVLNERHIPS